MGVKAPKRKKRTVRMTKLSVYAATLAMAILISAGSAQAAAPVAAISVNVTQGNAPLNVTFDASPSSADAVTFLWQFGDGAASTAKVVSHVYVVAGTYNAILTATNAGGESSTATIAITVAGTGEGPVTGNMNFRMALINGNFGLRHTTTNRDQTTLSFGFNTVDLPGDLRGLAASFSVNGAFTVNGIIGSEDGFQSAGDRKPEFEVRILQPEQRLEVFIAKADLKAAFAASGAGNINTPSGGSQVPVTFTFIIGAQTYTLTENFTYISTANAQGRGTFNIKKKSGSIRDGFFVISVASALENENSTGHFFTIDTQLSRPLQQLIQAPGSGSFRITLNEADTETILFDRLRTTGKQIFFDQQDRALRGTRKLSIDVEGRRMTIRSWDILSRSNLGGTGLPLRGAPFTAFNFTVRIEFDQPDGTVLQAVTATRLTRKSEDDALWQTGRRKKTN
jgi:PKD repeat protein